MNKKLELIDAAQNKDQTIKVIKENTGISLSLAKAVVDNIPMEIKISNNIDIIKMKQDSESVGAKVNFK